MNDARGTGPKARRPEAGAPRGEARAPLLTLLVAGAALALTGCGEEGERGGGAVAADGRPVGGHFRRARDPAGAWEREARELEALGYAAGTEAGRPGTGVVTLHPQKAQDGYFFFTSGHGPEGLLIDLEGTLVHRWRAGIPEIWPERAEAALRRKGRDHYWRRARLLDDGAVLCLFAEVGLAKLDRESRVQWAHSGRTHHDLDLDGEGRVLVLERETRAAPWLAGERPVVDDLVVVLGPEGEEMERISVLDAMLRSREANALRERLRRNYAEACEAEARARAKHPEAAGRPSPPGDILHTNTIQWLDGSHVQRSPDFARGNVLLSIRELDLLAVLDLERRKVVWTLSGRWRSQHEPVLLESGTILLFDNGGPPSRGLAGFSEILEIDPASGRVVWSWRASRAFEFRSMIAGTCQRLPGGNTLITESTQGRAFQVDPSGEIVWEYRSPFRAGDSGEFVAFMPEMTWIPAESVEPWLP